MIYIHPYARNINKLKDVFLMELLVLIISYVNYEEKNKIYITYAKS